MDHETKHGRLTRRALLGGAAGALVAGLTPPGARPASAAPATRSRVVLVRDATVLDGAGKIRAAVLEQMLDRAVVRLLDAPSAKAAWQRLVKPTDTVGIKSNVWQHLPTPPELERALRQRVVAAGVPTARVAVDDRGVRRHPVFQRATALINARPLRTHHWSGVGSLLKNYIMFAESPPAYHPDSCADLAKLWQLPGVAGKTRLNVLVLLTPLFYGVGPHHYDPQYVWRYGGLLVGSDPVAVDAVGLRILEAQRRVHFKEERRMRPPAHHIALADTRHRLGNADPRRIELIKLGWTEGALI